MPRSRSRTSLCSKISADLLEQAGRVLQGGGIVLHATEGVWGFACDPMNRDAVARVATLKQRSLSQGMLVIAAEAETFAAELARHDPGLRAQAIASWPGSHTWILPNVRFPEWVTGDRDTVGCRVPGHAQARGLCAAFGGALVSTSANRSGEPAVATEADARQQFGDLVDMVVSGAVLQAGQPSTIHDLAGAVIR